ncbi:MAG: glutamine-hydrolyzing carbamoyl-phosphate synthase small subunit [Cytophagales bacterium]
MSYSNPKKAYLLLEDGTYLEGEACGVIGTTGGEICFNTGMTGYQEIYTDPSYTGQVIINTVSHIGNYGVEDSEQESAAPKFAGLICKDFAEVFSRKTAHGSLQEYFEKHNVVGIYGVDTRMLVRHVRNNGAQNCVISSESGNLEFLKKKLSEVPPMGGLELSSVVSTKEAYFFGNENAPLKVAVLDLGVKTSILKNIAERGAYLKVFPAKTSFAEMESWKPNGYFISNGPGDPASMPYAAETVKEILAADKPLFGICLGHQILSRAMGVSTYKMHNGHRGCNQPVKNLITGKGEITSQNHGFAVDMNELKSSDKVELTHINLNDDTVEGIRVKGKKAFSVQYHPESSPGPHDSRYLFDDFITMIKG